MNHGCSHLSRRQDQDSEEEPVDQVSRTSGQINAPGVAFNYFASGTVPANVAGGLTVTLCTTIIAECANRRLADGGRELEMRRTGSGFGPSECSAAMLSTSS
jgi:hypothetical protein